jgi:hypothetical protein
VVLYPREKARAWSVGIPAGVSALQLTPVEHAAINLGAPGFREDDQKTLWAPYPARDVGGLLGDWLPAYQHDAAMCYRHSDDLLAIEGTDKPWVFTSGYAHTKPLRFTLIGRDERPAAYTVRLYFAEPDGLAPGRRVFDVFLQDEEVLTGFDVARESGGAGKALVREFRRIRVTDDLVVTLAPTDASHVEAPILCGIEAVRE